MWEAVAAHGPADGSLQGYGQDDLSRSGAGDRQPVRPTSCQFRLGVESVADTFKTRLDEQRGIVADFLGAESFLNLLTESLLILGGRFGGMLPLLPWTALRCARPVRPA